MLRFSELAYAESEELQQNLVQQRKRNEIIDQLILLEHPPVYTLGRGASLDHLLDTTIQPFRTTRGGEITYHGPGQLVVYPILLLEEGRRDLHRYLRDLEQVVIDLCGDYQVRAERVAGKTGVWVDGKKLASIGVRAASWVTSHGVALNYGRDLVGFEAIVPCGLQGVEMIGLSHILQGGLGGDGSARQASQHRNPPENSGWGEIDRSELEDRFCGHFSRIFDREIQFER